MPKYQGAALTHDIHEMEMEVEEELQLPLLSSKEQGKCKYPRICTTCPITEAIKPVRFSWPNKKPYTELAHSHI